MYTVIYSIVVYTLIYTTSILSPAPNTSLYVIYTYTHIHIYTYTHIHIYTMHAPLPCVFAYLRVCVDGEGEDEYEVETMSASIFRTLFNTVSPLVPLSALTMGVGDTAVRVANTNQILPNYHRYV
jgi:hypothetical protein